MGEPRVPPRWTMPTVIGARLPPASEQQADDRTCEQQLRLRRDAHAVTPAAAVEDLPPSQPEPRRDVLEIGHGRCSAAEHGRVERPARSGQQPERDEAATGLEAPVGNVLVRHPVGGDVEGRAEQERERTRPDEGSGGAAQRDVERDDHRPDDRLCSRAMGFLDRLRSLLASPPRIQSGGDPEAAADLQEEFGGPDEAAADVDRMAETGGGGGGRSTNVRYGASESAEAAHDDLASEETPPDPS